MFNWMKSRKFIVLMIGFIIFIGGIGFSVRERAQLTVPERVIMDSVASLQSLLYRPSAYVSQFMTNMTNLNQVYEENVELRKTAAAYARDRNRMVLMERQNERLQEALDFTERQKAMFDYSYDIAQVIAVNSDPLNPTVRINLGSKDGIKPNMAVVTVDGLLGFVSRVDSYYSNVMTLTQLDDRTSGSKSIAATALGREAFTFGMIDNYDEKKNLLTMSRINQNDPIRVGDIVVSSGLGEVFPQGLVVGTVVSRQVGDFGLTHTAMIKPAASFEQLSEVFVVRTR